MPEQGEDTGVVPALLGDLQDVDSAVAPNVGDTLTWDGTEWRAVTGASPSEYGPALTLFEGTYSGSPLADQNATNAAWLAMDVQRKSNYATYPGVQPILGSFSPQYAGTQRWTPDEPGIYSLYSLVSASINDVPSAGAFWIETVPISVIFQLSWGADTQVHATAPITTVLFTRHLYASVSQGMIDAGVAGYDFGSPRYDTGGGLARITDLGLNVLIERHSPGSAFDYYGDL